MSIVNLKIIFVKKQKQTLERPTQGRGATFIITVMAVFPGGYSIYPRVGRCGAAPHTLTLFKTNIADFPTLFKTFILFKTRIDKSIP